MKKYMCLILPHPHLECCVVPKGCCYVFVQIVVQKKMWFFSGYVCSDPLLRRPGSVSSNLALVTPESFSINYVGMKVSPVAVRQFTEKLN